MTDDRLPPNAPRPDPSRLEHGPGAGRPWRHGAPPPPPPPPPMHHRFEIDLYPPRWWRRSWKAVASLVETTQGLARFEGGSIGRLRISGFGDSSTQAVHDVQARVNRWAADQRARKAAATDTIVHEVET